MEKLLTNMKYTSVHTWYLPTGTMAIASVLTGFGLVCSVIFRWVRLIVPLCIVKELKKENIYVIMGKPNIKKIIMHFYQNNLICVNWAKGILYLPVYTATHMYEIKNAFNPLTAAIGRPFFGHTSPAARARELFKSSTDSASLLVDIEKNVFRFWWGFSGGDVTLRAWFENFGHLWPALGLYQLTHSIGSKLCWKLGQNPHL